MAETTMVGAKPTWFVDKLWRGQRFEAYGHGYGIQLGMDEVLGTIQLFIQDADSLGIPSPKSNAISVDVISVQEWDRDDADGVAVVSPAEFNNKVVVVGRGALSAWDQAVQAAEMAMAAFNCGMDWNK